MRLQAFLVMMQWLAGLASAREPALATKTPSKADLSNA
jgi:hypothetical protein